jgi:hypothetical protein
VSCSSPNGFTPTNAVETNVRPTTFFTESSHVRAISSQLLAWTTPEMLRISINSPE